ncbi:MAG: hypothetical protein HY709_06550 [Candidatus Latescibacteria bacterium]|nr:hypothetical protein [Candidatus Latescibacterota bacterium]
MMWTLLSGVLILSLSGLVTAHEDVPMRFAAGIHPARLAQITFDGKLDDWAWMPATFVYTRDEFTTQSTGIQEGRVSREDFDILLYVGWSPDTQMLYHAIQVTDDAFFSLAEGTDQAFGEDVFQWPVDPDHSGGPLRPEGADSKGGQQIVYTPDENTFRLYGPQELAWTYKEPWLFFGSSKDGASWTLEMAAVIWDWLDTSPETSIRHRFEAGQIIGWTALIKDTDSQDDREQVRMTPRDAAQTTDFYADLFMVSIEDTEAEVDQTRYPLPTAVESETWGRIKSTFVK